MKKLKLWILVFSLFFLSSCAATYDGDVHNPLTEEEIIEYVKSEIKKNSGDDVNARIVYKKPLEICEDDYIPCFYDRKIRGAHSYSLEVTNINNPDISAIVVYIDAYYDNHIEKVREARIDNEYYRKQKIYYLEQGMKKLLDESEEKYYLLLDQYDKHGYHIFINTTNFDKLETISNGINNLLMKYKDGYYTLYVNFDIYVYKDSEIFNSIDFESYKNYRGDENNLSQYGNFSNPTKVFNKLSTVSSALVASNSKLDYDLFITDGKSNLKEDAITSYDGYKYFVFIYKSCSNSFDTGGVSSVYGIYY